MIFYELQNIFSTIPSYDMHKGGVYVENKNTDILYQYGLETIKTGRCRGAVAAYTDEGIFLIRAFSGNVKRLELEEKLLDIISQTNKIYTDNIIRNEAGELISEDEAGKKFIVRKWYNATDCDLKNHSHIIRAVKALALLHNIMNENSINDVHSDDKLVKEFDRHNMELKRARNYIRSKRKKNEFELMIIGSFDEFFADGEEVCRLADMIHIEELIKNEIKNKRMMHGAYNYHNVLFVEEKGRTDVLVTNFDRVRCGVQIRDLYDFMRKVLEKNSWDIKLGNEIIEEYLKVRTVSEQELHYLRLKLKYPEKYWKLLSHYYNNNKAWIPDKDIEKLKQVIMQHEKRLAFVNSVKI